MARPCKAPPGGGHLWRALARPPPGGGASEKGPLREGENAPSSPAQYFPGLYRCIIESAIDCAFRAMFNPETASDEELLSAFARVGDAAAMTALVERHGAALGAFLAGWCEEKADAQDVAQETWLKVMRSPQSFRGGSFRAWVLRIARNQVIDRARVRKPDVSLDAPIGDSPLSPGLVETLADDKSPSPVEALASAEERAVALAAIRALPAPQRDVFLLRAAGISFSEIATRFSIPLNTALGRMHYAMKALKKELCADDERRH